MKWMLKGLEPKLPPIGGVGDFGSRRSFYNHPGVDEYCGFGQEIIAIESGRVVNVEYFTGPNAEPTSPWWNETWSVMIEGEHGVIGYCEIQPLPHIKKDLLIEEGELIGTVIPVLKRDKGNGTTMCHVELYVPGTTEHVTWLLDTEKPKELLNSRELLESIKKEYEGKSS